MASDAFQKFGDSMNRAITKISVKTSSTLEKSKIKLHIDSLSKEVQKMLSDLGESTYALWLNGETSIQSLTEKLDAIKEKKATIEQLSAELDAIDARDNEILGTKAETEEKPEAVASQGLCCPSCGASCEPTAKFCRKCGYKIQ